MMMAEFFVDPASGTVCERTVVKDDNGVYRVATNAPEAEPTELEQLRADVDYIAMETGVDL